MNSVQYPLSVSIGSEVYTIEFPNAPGRLQDIIVRDSEGLIVVLPHEERIEVFEIYEFVHSLKEEGTFAGKLATITDSFWNLTNVQNQFLTPVVARKDELAEELPKNAADIIARDAEPFIEFTRDTLIDAVLEQVLKKSPGVLGGVIAPVLAIDEALGVIHTMAQALRLKVEEPHLAWEYAALLAAESNLNAYMDLYEDIQVRVFDLQGVNYATATVSVEDFAALEADLFKATMLFKQSMDLITATISWGRSETVRGEDFANLYSDNRSAFDDFLARLENELPIYGNIKDTLDEIAAVVGIIRNPLGGEDLEDVAARIEADIERLYETEGYFHPNARTENREAFDGIGATGTDGSDFIFGNEKDTEIFGLDGDDVFYLNAAAGGPTGSDIIIGGEGNDIVAIHGAAFDADSLSDERPDGSFSYTLSSNEKVTLYSVEQLLFVDTGESIALDATARITAIGGSSTFSVLSSNVTASISETLTGNALTVDHDGNLASVYSDTFTWSSTYSYADTSLRVNSIDAQDGTEQDADYYIGNYSYSVQPSAFDYVAGYGEVAIHSGFYLGEGLTALILEDGTVYGEPAGSYQYPNRSWDPTGTAHWSIFEETASDPVENRYVVGDRVRDSASHNGDLVVLGDIGLYSGASGGQRLLAVSPSRAISPTEGHATTSYQHLAFLADTVDFRAIAFNETGTLFGVGIETGQIETGLYEIDSTTGTVDLVGLLPEGIEDFVISGSREELEELLAKSAPVAADITVGADYDTPALGMLAAVDADGDALTFSLISGPRYGTATVSDDGTFSYVPDVGFFGTDSFVFSASDEEFSDEGTVTVNTSSTNDILTVDELSRGNPAVTLAQLRDFDGNDLGSADGWKPLGSVDVRNDGDEELVYVNPDLGRWATIGPTSDGQIDLTGHGEGGETRVVGVYLDPLVENGTVEKGSDIDSARRFENDLRIENLDLLGGGDYDGDGLQQLYFKTTDGTAYLHALMHADGNIRYANYQSEAQMVDYLSTYGYDGSTYDDWL